MRGGLSKGGAAAGDVLLRTSDYGLTTDAAISILADEVEQRIGETIQHGENEELILVGYGNAITVEEGLSVPPEKPAAHPPAPTSAHTTVKHALEFDAILALERASFDDAIIAELESYGFLLSSIFSPENPYRRRDIYLDIEASEALGVEAAAERAKFDHEIIQHFEEHEASLVMLGGEQYLHEQYLPRPQGQKLVDGPDCKLKNAPAAREDSNQQIMADLEAYEASLEAAYLHEYQGDETQITAELEEADIFFDIFTFEECVDEKYNFEQGIISDFESWEAELQRRGEEYNRQVGPESAGTVGESARTSGDSEETSASSATLLHETAVPLESASVNATLEKYHVQEQAWWEGGEDSTSAAPPQICSENFSSEIREAFEGRGGGLRRFRGVLKEEVVAVDKFGPQNIPKEDEAIGSTPQPKRVYPNLADLVVRTSSLNQMLHTSVRFPPCHLPFLDLANKNRLSSGSTQRALTGAPRSTAMRVACLTLRMLSFCLRGRSSWKLCHDSRGRGVRC